jgi:hypothetical protein
MKRRKFIERTNLFSAGLLFPHLLQKLQNQINDFVVSGWQDVNIGDGHT